MRSVVGPTHRGILRQVNASRSRILAWQKQNDAAYAKAVRSMRWRRVKELWIAFGMMLGHVISPILLTVLYLTLFVPFGVLGRLSKKPRGWVAVKRVPGRKIEELRNPA